MSRVRWIGAGLLALAALAGLALDRKLLLASWLAAWWWCLGIVLGCFVNLWLHRLTGGRWGEPIRAAALVLASRMPWVLLALVPVAGGVKWLYPWAGQSDAWWTGKYAQPVFVHVWLSQPFFLARLAVYALAWWWLARPASLVTKGRTCAALVIHALLTSAAAVDLLMSLVPQWYSTAFGLVVMCMQALSGAAVAVLLGVHASLVRREPSRPGVPVSRDLGNVLLMWIMLWGYVAFMQFLIIWAENLPHEIAWYVPRVQTGWRFAGVALVVLQLAVPFLALLFRSVKDKPSRLAGVAALVLAASALDAAWMVLPSVDAHDWNGWWLMPLTVAGMALLLFGGLGEELRHAATQPQPGGLRHAHP
jgi:hypothetical protein